MEMTPERLNWILNKAAKQAHKAANEFFTNQMSGEDKGSCGFAWVNLFEYQGKRITGNTKMGRMLKKVGVTQNWARTFHVWNPAQFPCQNIDTLEVGAREFARVMKEHGFNAAASSRLD